MNLPMLCRWRVPTGAAAAMTAALVLVAPGAAAEPAETTASPDATAAASPVAGLVRPVRGAPVLRRPAAGVLRSQRVALDPSLLPDNAVEAARGVELPLFPDTEVVAELAVPVLAPAGYQAWHGSLAGSDDSSVVLVESGGALVGYVADPELGSYRLRSDADGSAVVEQVDVASFASEQAHPAPAPARAGTPQMAGSGGHVHAAHTHAPVPVGAPGTAAASAVVPAAAGAPVIDVLVAYTAAARTAKGGQAAMEADVALAVEQTNLAFATSGVAASLRLVHTAEVALNGDADGTSLDRLRLPADGWNDEVHVLRDQHGADLVALVVDDTANQWCGMAYLMNNDSVGFASWAFSVVDVHCSTGTLTFAHEIGHSFGAAHDRGSWSGTPAYPYGYDWVNPTAGWRTVMAYPNACPGCARLARFSNPDQTHDGAPLGAPVGAPNAADNRALLNLTASTVQSFRGTPVPAGLTVTAPAAGARVPVTGRLDVTWATSGNPGPYVRVELLRGSTPVATVAAAAGTGPGSHSWTVPATLPVGTDYRVRVTSTTSPGLTASSSPFSLVDPAITVTSHGAAHTWSPGAPQTVTWTYAGAPGGTVRVELVREERVLVVLSKTAPLGTGGSGSFTFAPPPGLGAYDGFRVRATLGARPWVSDTSDGDAAYPGAAAVRLTSHNGATSWTAGSAQTVTWQTSGAVGANVRLELLKGQLLAGVISAGRPAAEGSYTWTLPAKLPTGDDYRVRAVAASYPLLTDSSDVPFHVTGTSVTVTGPAADAALVTGVPVPVTWSSVGAPGTAVKLELVPPVGTPSLVASAAPLAAGTFSWTPPVSLPPGAGYRLRATVNGNVLVTDAGDVDLTLQSPVLAVPTASSSTWTAGVPVSVSWSFSDGAAVPVTVQLVRGTTVKALGTRVPTPPGGSGSLTWTPPLTLPPAADYAVRVVASAAPALQATSPTPVVVRHPTLTVSVSSTEWVVGQPVSVTWTLSEGAALPVDVALVRGTTTAVIGRGRATLGGSGSYTWTPPATAVPATDYRLRVSASPALRVTHPSWITLRR